MASGRSSVRFGDWMFLAMGVMFCAASLFLLPRNPRMGTGTLLMFGPCALLAVERIRSKRRRDRFQATRVSALGGVELRMSKRNFLLISVFATSMGSSVFFYPAAPVWVMAGGGLFVAAGIAMAVAVASGVLARRFLRFDPDGITLGEWFYSYRVDWDNIANLAEFEYASNDCVGFELIDPERVAVTPEARRAAWIRHASNNAALLGPHVVIMTTHFGVEPASLAAALMRYVTDVSARAELTPQPALPPQS